MDTTGVPRDNSSPLSYSPSQLIFAKSQPLRSLEVRAPTPSRPLPPRNLPRNPKRRPVNILQHTVRILNIPRLARLLPPLNNKPKPLHEPHNFILRQLHRARICNPKRPASALARV